MTIQINSYANKGKRKLSTIQGDEYFQPIVDGKELSMVAETEDMAMLIGLGYKYDGRNSQFAVMAARMLDMDTCWKGLDQGDKT